MERAKAVAVDVTEPLALSEILNYFKASSSSTPTFPPVKPKAGEVYLITVKDESSKNDWRADGYRWFQYGTKNIPRSKPSIRKVHFVSVLPSGHDKRFRRQAMFLINNDKAVLIHYLGDENIAMDYPHGNSKNGANQVYQRTCPSVLSKLAAEQDLPSNVYKKAISSIDCPLSLQPVHTPRNSRQVINLQQRERQKFRLTHDALYNLHELSYDLNGFVIEMSTYPDLVVICGLNEIINEAKLVLQIESECPQLLSYDTTFQLGDFYLSPILFRHTLFSKSPVIPLLFLIHERKYQKVHEAFMKCLADLLPILVNGKYNIPLVTDEESGINMAVKKYLPKVTRLRCWNHTINAVKCWLKKHGATSAEIPAYISHLRDLLNQPNIECYEKKLREYQMIWSEPFNSYFMSDINVEVSALGRWVLDSLNLYHPFTGVTTNQSESFNSTLKRLQRWKEVPVDSIVLSLYHLQVYYHNEIQRGLAGLGNYNLLRKEAARSPDEILLLRCYSPDQIIDQLQENYISGSSTEQTKDVITNDNKTNLEDSHLTEENEECAEDSQELPTSTPYSRARFILKNNQISHNQSLGVFTVIGTTGNAHAIRIFPYESCTCPSTGRCYHILAVRMSIGLDDANSKQKINLTQLRRNTRSRKEKKSGRKAPRPGDYNIIPAPDCDEIKQKHNGYSQLISPRKSQQLVRSPENSQQSNQEILNSQWDHRIKPSNRLPGSPGQNLQSVKSPAVSQQSIVSLQSRQKVENGTGKKRKRCGDCAGCIAVECGKCRNCLDKPKFGGRGVLKQCCMIKKCKRLKLAETGNTTQHDSSLKLTSRASCVANTLNVLSNNKNSIPVVCTINRCNIFDCDLNTLKDENWLNDKIIDAYVFLVMEHANRKAEKSAYSITSLFYTALTSFGCKKVYNWIKEDDVDTYAKLFVPVNTGCHWGLAVADFEKNELRWYDSLGGDGTQYLYKIRDYLDCRIKKLDVSNWKLLCPKDIPHQSNSYDCGVFVCMFARYQAFNKIMDFYQDDVTLKRTEMLAEIKQKRLFNFM